jgi:hypothetical protein
VTKTRPVPRQTYLSSLSDCDADLGESEFEELLQDMQLPTYATEEYEEYDQVVSDSHEEEEEEEEELYEDYYDKQEEQDDAMFWLHQPSGTVPIDASDETEEIRHNLIDEPIAFCTENRVDKLEEPDWKIISAADFFFDFGSGRCSADLAKRKRPK